MVVRKHRGPYGQGRVAFFAELPAIKDEIKRGFTLRTVHAKREKTLKIGYSGFYKLVRRYATDACLPK